MSQSIPFPSKCTPKPPSTLPVHPSMLPMHPGATSVNPSASPAQFTPQINSSEFEHSHSASQKCPSAIPNPTQCIPVLPQHITVHQLHLGAMPVHPSSSQCNSSAIQGILVPKHPIPSSTLPVHPRATPMHPGAIPVHSSATPRHPGAIPAPSQWISVLLQCIPVNQVHPAAMPVPSQCHSSAPSAS